ncbi:elongation factor P [Helcococcus ovis]|uniref:Elongation factor P n=1 Tax=Helcococcus ovis TaxID=72026 RepID=A0A4R9C2D0_9FIRM|nr:elongation factor P [Helcococcus ovis]TFF64478.1 elongation factor P [Helcococcus ovis]TFF64912.1 elongation factor P [Helcococcus ovis]TFF68127.1 elongation factor P [Helcococcus ovis]WNZ01986.1 elongation factor P [Helcococcus ovis]
MIGANEIKKGMTLEYDNGIYEVLDFQHVKPGKGPAFIRTKIRNVMNGSSKDVTLNPNDKFNQVIIETKEMQYLYNDGTLYYFMDPETYEQIPMDYDIFEEASQFVKENTNAIIKFYNGKAFSIEAPNFVELEVTDTEPGFKGDTAQGATKPATVETGYTLNVPLFIEIGTVLKIDTRTGEYLSRV